MGECYFKAAATVVPGLFGDGSDGDLVIHNGETVSLPVTVPHQSVVEKQYNSILIEAGGTLTCSDPNAGLVLRCKGDCTIQGTIDQSGKAPKTNPNNNYDYPAELQCGDGGSGGGCPVPTSLSGDTASGGAGMRARPYGGGWSGGGSSGGVSYNKTICGMSRSGGGVDNVTVDLPDDQCFVAGKSAGAVGINGGGSCGYIGNTISGIDGPGASPAANMYTVGGNGTLGGGVVLLYVGGTLSLEGTINCSGWNGGNGCQDRTYFKCSGVNVQNNVGSGGGGAGGGAIYIVHFGECSNVGSLNVNGGSPGVGGNPAPVAGGLGSVTVKQYEKGMTV